MDEQSRPPVSEVRALLQEAKGAHLRRLLAHFASDERAGVVAAVAAARALLRREEQEARRLKRLYRYEDDLRAAGVSLIAGVDEVGRGALAGPLTVGVCVLPAHPHVIGLDDSKRLTPGQRVVVAERIRETALAFHVVHVPAVDVDALGVTAALRRAMHEAVAGLGVVADHVVVDGRPMNIAQCESAVIGGDARVAAIAAASVLAKVERDAYMTALADDHPGYGFDDNKGYGTPSHLQALAKLGPSPQHRLTFCPGAGTQRLF